MTGGDIAVPALDGNGQTRDFLLPLLETLPEDRSVTPDALPVAAHLWGQAAAEWAPVGGDGDAETTGESA